MGEKRESDDMDEREVDPASKVHRAELSGCGYRWPPSLSVDTLKLSTIAAAPGDTNSDSPDCVSKLLLASGMSASVALEKRKLFASAAKRLLDEGLSGDAPARAFWVPGRIEVSGKHTDYAGGRSLLVAATRGFAVVTTHRDDANCRMFTTVGAKHSRESATMAIGKELQPQHGHWSAYPAVAIRRLARNFDINLGVDIALERDLPGASGMSSSSAIICLLWLILAERNGICKSKLFLDNLTSPEELFSYLGFIENGQDCGNVLVGDKGVGTFGGSEDHTAIMSSEAGKLKMFSYCPTKHEGTFGFPSSLVFVIAVSGAFAEKTGDAMEDYNNAAFLARDAAAAWVDSVGSLPLDGCTFVPKRANLAEVVRHVRNTTGGDEAHVKAVIGDAIAKLDDGKSYGPCADKVDVRYKSGALRERFEQFYDESEVLTPQLAAAIGAADSAGIGRASDESHRQTVCSLRNTIPETAWLPQEARQLGALGASAFGAGFGGSCWALVEAAEADGFCTKWREAYLKRFPRWADTCEFFAMTPGPGAFSMP